ncbi:hypothetical protein U1Q18_008088 [Sarracenia purpurea var. burkii]
MSVKECDHHRGRRRRRCRRLCAWCLIVNFIILFFILLVWAALQPRKPRFIIQDVTVYAFNFSAPNYLTSNFQVTIFSRNPNSKIGIYYDRLVVYAAFQSQQITYFTDIPPVYQGHKDVTVWPPFVAGSNVPVAPYYSAALGQVQNSGLLLLTIKLDGRVRFKIGTFTTGRYNLHVKCPATISFGNQNSGYYVGNAVKFQLSQSCSVTV